MLTCKKESPVSPPSGQDTTSHNFEWIQHTFGGPNGSSGFKDVAVVSDTDIWAVGEIYMASDTLYNAAHWNGREWELERVPYYYQSQPLYNSINSVFAFNSNDVWFGIGSLIHWDGHNFNPVDLSNVLGPHSIYKIWGTSNSGFYIVGDRGAIAFYDGSNWTKQASATTIDLRDIWGTPDGSVVWASGYSNDNSQSVLLKSDGTTWTTVWSSHPSAPPYGGLIESLWGDEHLYLVGTDGAYKQDVTGETNIQHLFTLTHFPYRVKGSSEDNIAFVGDNAMIYHYNGSTWQLLNYSGLDQPLYSVAVSTNLIVAVGSDYTIGFGAALIYFGKRSFN